MNKILKCLTLALTLMLVLSLVACNGNTKVADSKKIKITSWEKPAADSTPEELQSYEDMMVRVKAKFPNIEFVEIARKQGTDYRQAYDKALMAGEAPTFFSSFSYTDIPSRIKNGTIADMTEFVKNWDMKKEEKVITQFDTAISSNDKWYAIPRSAYIQGTLYNKKSISAGGGDTTKMPETWDEFAALGQKITDFSVPRIGYELVGMDWNVWPFTAWVWSAGGEMVHPNGDGTYKLTFTDEPAIDAAMFLNQMVWKYKMTQKDVLQDWSKLEQDIKSGRACFAWSTLNVFGKKEYETYNISLDDLGVIPLPVKDKSIARPSLAGGEVYTFNPKATKEELKAAWDIVTYINYDQEELAKQWALTNQHNRFDYAIPARKDLLEAKFNAHTFVPKRIKDEYFAMSPNAIAEPFCPNWTDLKNSLANPLQKIFLSEKLTRNEAKAILEECANDLYKRYPNSFKK